MKSFKPFLTILLMFLVSAVAGVQVEAKTISECDSCIEFAQDVSEVLVTSDSLEVVTQDNIITSNPADQKQGDSFVPPAEFSAELLQYQGKIAFRGKFYSWNDYLPKNINAPPRAVSLLHNRRV